MAMQRFCMVLNCKEKVDYNFGDKYCYTHAFYRFQKNMKQTCKYGADKCTHQECFELKVSQQKDCGHGNCSKDVIEALADHCALLTKRIEKLEERVADMQDGIDANADCVTHKVCASCNAVGHWSESCPTKKNKECQQDCDHEGIVTHMNKWRRKYKKAFKDAETFWKYFFKELREQLEGDYEVEDNDDDEEGPFNHGVCNVLDCTCDCKDCK